MDKERITKIMEGLNDEQKEAIQEIFDEMNTIEHNDTKIDAAGLIADGIKMGSLKDSIIHGQQTYGIKEINELFPNHKEDGAINVIRPDEEWVSVILNGIHRLPFSRVKNMTADYRNLKATFRAAGYKKASQKKESELLGILSRITDPTTIYIKEKIDRDDLIDIKDFQVVSWIKEEMRLALNREFALAILLGDGRSNVAQDKISEECIRPIVSDDDLFTAKVEVVGAANASDAEKLLEQAIKSRKLYRGSGRPIFFTNEDFISNVLLLKDKNGRKMYSSLNEVQEILRVSSIVTLPELEGYKRKLTEEDGNDHEVMGIMVNPADYKIGSDRGGEPTLFDDFDIDFNQQKYLMEARRSGALTKPLSAVVFERVAPGAKTVSEPNTEE